MAEMPRAVLDAAFEHEHLEVFRDRATGLTGVIAIHSTALGPAMGGARLRSYSGVQEAAVDALRLARAMTLKNAAAGLDLGGGKAVLLDDGGWHDRPARMAAFAEVLDRLGGRYVTAEDVGTSPGDMDLLAARTRWVAGRSHAAGGFGDPSPSTARTVFGAICEAAASVLGSTSLAGVSVGVLGAGKVGAALVDLLAGAGAEVLVADVDASRAAVVAARAGACAVPVDGFLERAVDVLAPCAFGELIGEREVAGLRCCIVAGAANNQLVDRAAAVALGDAGILYVPDFLANCGGIVCVGAEFAGLDRQAVEDRLRFCVLQVREVLAEARAQGRLPLDVAIERALRRIDAAARRG
jgi:glutamate dehydrogenase/leucine dehydrogenase